MNDLQTGVLIYAFKLLENCIDKGQTKRCFDV